MERSPAAALSVLNRPVNIGKEAGQITFRSTAKTLKLLSGDEKPGGEGEGSAEKQRSSYVFSDAYTPVVVGILENIVLDGWQASKLEKALSPVFCTTPAPPKPDSRLRKVITRDYLAFYLNYLNT